MKYIASIYTILILSLFWSCQSSSTDNFWTMEELEVYTVDKSKKEITRGVLSFKETKITDDKDRRFENWYYNRNDQLTAFERFDYNGNERNALRSNYYDFKDSLLSYYIYEYDAKGNEISKKSYDAASDELLRIENFSHDDKNNRTGREIRDAMGRLVRRYDFRFDKQGNESSYSVYDAEGKLLVAETLAITKNENKNKEWSEAWSIRNEEPNTIRLRTIKRFLPQEIKDYK